MNGKKAKRLRAKARATTMGMPDVAYHPYTPKTLTAAGVPRLLKGGCTRFSYKIMKRESKGLEIRV